MKKIVTFCVATVFMMLVAVSCNRICVCTDTHENPNIPTNVYDVDLGAAGLKKCSDMDMVIDDPTGRTIVKCVNKTN